MNAHRNSDNPFGFWLVQNFLPADEEQTPELTPMSDREFYLSMGMVALAFGLFSLFVRGMIF